MPALTPLEACVQASVRSAIADELHADALEGRIVVRLDGRRLLLHGKLPNVKAKKRVVRAASSVAPRGFSLVDNLRVMPSMSLSDDRTCTDVAERLKLCEALESCAVAAVCSRGILRLRRPGPWADGEIVASASDGEVHLFGRVACPSQRALAEAVAWHGFGTANVVTKLAVTRRTADDDEVTEEVVWYVLRHEPILKDCVFFPSVCNGRVSLQGLVSSHMLQQVAEGSVWLVPGVQEVSNGLLVTAAPGR